MAALLLCALYSGERLFVVGFVLMAMMLALSAVSMLYSGLTFKYMQTLTPPTGTKGDTLVYGIELHNEHLFPVPYIRLYYDNIDSLLSGGRASAELSLPPRAKGEHSERIYCRYRGRWAVGVKQVEIRDLFGLFAVRLDVTRFLSHKQISLLVRPRVLHLSALPMRRKNDEGPMETAPVRTEDTAMLSDIRKYRFGDQMKKIHWKLTARQREIMVKNYEETSLPDLLLYVDTHLKKMGMLDRLNLEDTLVESATAVVHHLLENCLPTSLVFYAGKRMHLRGSRPEHFQSFYAVLSEMPFDGQYPAEDVLMNDLEQVTHAGNLFLITSGLSDRLFDLVMMMNGSGINITLLYVHEPADGGELPVRIAVEAGRVKRMISEMRNAGVVVIDMKPGDNLAERVDMLQ